MRFAEILVTATAVTGAIWLIDSLFWRHKRMMRIMPGSYGSGVKEPWYVEYSKAFFPILLIVLILRSFLAEPFRIPSSSMHPTLLEGDFILVNKFTYGLRVPVAGNKLLETGKPKRGDVVVFKHTKKDGESIDMIKRVIGLPGDHITYKDNTIYINDKPVKQEFLADILDSDSMGDAYPVRKFKEELNGISHDIFVRIRDKMMTLNYPYQDVQVPNDSYFVMGDNRDNSQDSRFWGFVKDEDLQGRAFGIWMSWDADTNRPRWHRIASPII
jgi:signal peptidase I